MPQVHHITPGRADKNLGKAVNDIVKLLPDKDWVCLRDVDTLPVYHEKFFEQCEAIAERGGADLVGCMTNRVGLPHLTHGGALSDDMDIAHHRKIAIKYYKSYGSKVFSTEDYIAGFFMMFPKQTWVKIGGFPEGKILMDGKFVDWWVCDMVAKQGLKIGIAKGIYLFHIYRSWKSHPADIRHLI